MKSGLALPGRKLMLYDHGKTAGDGAANPEPCADAKNRLKTNGKTTPGDNPRGARFAGTPQAAPGASYFVR